MPAWIGWLFLLALLPGYFATSGAAGADAYFKLEGVMGEVLEVNHSNWIKVAVFENTLTRSSNTVPQVLSAGFCLQKTVDKASPALRRGAASGQRFASANLELITTDARRARFYQIVLNNVVIRAVGAQEQDGLLPVETVCLNFSQIYWTYTEFDAAGAPKNDIKAWWDVVANTAGDSVSPLFRVTATQVDAGTLRLSWPAIHGTTYRILGSGRVDGGYQFVRSVTAASDGLHSETFPIDGRAHFFLVQPVPP